MALEHGVQHAKESSNEVKPKKYSMFIASKAVEGDRTWLDVTNKYTNDVGMYVFFLSNLNYESALFTSF